MSITNIAYERAQAKQRMWNVRRKRKTTTEGQNGTYKTSPEKILSPYSSRQAQGKAARRVQYALPNSPRKKVFTVNSANFTGLIKTMCLS